MGLVISETLGITVAMIEDAALLDPVAIEAIGRQLYELVDEKARRKLVLDMRRLQHVSSQMIGVVIQLHRKSEAIKGRLVVCGMQPKVFEGFKLMRLDKILTIVDDEAAASRTLGGV